MTRTLNSLSNKGIVFYDNQARTVFKDALSTYIEHRMLYREFHAENGSAPQHWGDSKPCFVGLAGTPRLLVFHDACYIARGIRRGIPPNGRVVAGTPGVFSRIGCKYGGKGN